MCSRLLPSTLACYSRLSLATLGLLTVPPFASIFSFALCLAAVCLCMLLACLHITGFGFRFQMSDFEYANDSNQEEWEVPFNHLTCCLCQSLALLPVRLQHISMTEDCGTVTCQSCYKRWYRNLVDVPGPVPCPCCRSPCQHPSPEHAIPVHVTV